jgi:hypothetical protein
LSPRPVKTARRTVFLVSHWKLLLVLTAILGPLVGASYYSCSRTSEGCSVFSVITGAVRIVAKPFT